MEFWNSHGEYDCADLNPDHLDVYDEIIIVHAPALVG